MLVIVLAGFALLTAWVAQHVVWDEIKIPMPLRGEALRNPYYAAQKLVEALGATSERRQIIGDLATDAVVVLTDWGWDVSPARRHDFERWVEAGGRLVVDTSLITGSDVFEKWSGIERVRVPEDPDKEVEPPQFSQREADEACPEINEISRSESTDDPLSYAVCGVSTDDWLSATRPWSWQLGNDIGAQVMRVARGQGSVTVINATPFRYRGVFRGDHGALLVDAVQLRAGDHVVFMSEDHYDSLLTLVWRFGAPAVILFLTFVALALWRGGQRFGPLAAETVTARRSLAEQIRGTGRFTLRWGGGAALHAAAVRALAEAAARRVAGYERLGRDAQTAAVSKLAAVDAGELARAMSYSTDRSFELQRALASLEMARRHLIGSQWAKHGKRN
jgi:hypothetical protein